MNWRLHSVLVVTLAGAVATPAAIPALGQIPATAPAGRRRRANRAAISDFSGAWFDPGLGFGPPLSGPGPVRNKTRLPTGASNFSMLVGDYTNPILKPAAAEAVKKFGEISASGIAYPDPDNMCLQYPLPYLFWNFSMRMLQQPDRVTFIYAHDNDYRHVRLNQQHPAVVVPSLHGDSVGHYEGDTLVVDTVGIKEGPTAWLTGSARLIRRPCTWSNVTASLILKPRRQRSRSRKEWPRTGAVDPNYRGGACNSNSRSMMTAFSPCRGRRPSPTAATPIPIGMNGFAPKMSSTTIREPTSPTRTRTCRQRTSLIFEGQSVRRRNEFAFPRSVARMSAATCGRALPDARPRGRSSGLRLPIGTVRAPASPHAARAVPDVGQRVRSSGLQLLHACRRRARSVLALRCGPDVKGPTLAATSEASAECRPRRSPLLSRRDVLTTAVAAGAGLALASQGSEPAQARFEGRTIVDLQVHLWLASTPECPWPADGIGQAHIPRRSRITNCCRA